MDTPPDAAPRRRFALPSPYTVLVAVIALAALATWLVPPGQYASLTYQPERRVFVVATPGGEERLVPATQAALDSLGLRASLADFEAGVFSKPVTVPGTYRRVATDPQGPLDVLRAPIEGLYEAIDVVLLVLIIGGFIGVFNRSGAFDAGLAALARRLRGRESLLVILATVLMALGGTTFGMAEETIAFYPLLVPVFLAAGYDRMVPLAVILGGTHVGSLASTTNPFSVIIASDAAGVAWTTGLGERLAVLVVGVTLLCVYVLRYARRVRLDPSKSLAQGGDADLAVAADRPALAPPLTGRVQVLLVLFSLTFLIMIWGVARGGWWFSEMTALFLGASIVIAFVQQTSERAFVASFLEGARDLLGVAFIIGVARGVTVVLNAGGLSGTLLASATSVIGDMPPFLFLLALVGFYALLTVVVPSSSGMAVLTMPIMGALSPIVGAPPDSVVSAYLYGIGLMFLVSPSGLVLPSVALAGVGYDRWLRFVGPLIGLLAVVCAIALALGLVL